jgi:SAM-dependent methyltransferase
MNLSDGYNHLKLVEHYTNCFRKHGDTHEGVDWPNLKDLVKRYEVMLGLIRGDSQCSLLDFGCGTAMLYQHILNQGLEHIHYSGLDLGSEYVSAASAKFPSVAFHEVDILKDPEKAPKADYIVMNGVLTEKQSLSFDEMWAYSQALLPLIFQKCNMGMAFNVMSKAVDWEREDLFHMPLDLLARFLVDKVSRHFIIRNDYDLFEYTVYVYKKPWQK